MRCEHARRPRVVFLVEEVGGGAVAARARHAGDGLRGCPNEPEEAVLALVIAIGFTIAWPRFTKLNAFFSLITASLLFGLIAGMPWSSVINSLQTGFGGLLQQIGILVAFGSVLGSVLEKTYAMNTISQGMLKLLGPRNPVLAMTAIGFLVGIPVFCDSGFIILSRLIPSIASRRDPRTKTITTKNITVPQPKPI
jgi:H+/gluconate symporter-like permease